MKEQHSDAKRLPRVLIVHNYYQIPGGEDTVVANEKKLLEENGHFVALYKRENAEMKSFSKKQKLGLPFTTVFNPRTVREVKRLIREQKIDIVHVHNTLNLISPSVYYAAFRCRVPVVQTIHNFRLMCPGATLYRDGRICEDCVKGSLCPALKHSCYRGSRLQTLASVLTLRIHRMLHTYGRLNYICLTEFNKEKLQSIRQIRKERIYVKPNFAERTVPVQPFEARKKQIIFAGRLDELKGIEILFRSWKKMGAQAPLLLVCGTGPMEDWCREFLKKNPETKIEMKGFVPNENARVLISESQALILPTQWYEGFPMTIVEAFSVGTPVLGSDMGNVGSLIVEDRTGWKFLPTQEESLIEAVHRVHDITASVVEEYEAKYSRQSNYRTLLHIYHSLGRKVHGI